MEQGWLSAWFPRETWGRRAPWYLTHTFVLAASLGGVYLFPSQDAYVLCWWSRASGARGAVRDTRTRDPRRVVLVLLKGRSAHRASYRASTYIWH